MTDSRRAAYRLLLECALAIACVIFGYWFFRDYVLHQNLHQGYGRTDFAVFYVTAAAVTGQQGLSPEILFDRPAFRDAIKSVRVQSGGTKYIYSLSSSVLFAPLVLLPYKAAWKIWITISFISFVGAYYLFVRTWLQDNPLRVRYSVLLLMTLFSHAVQKLFFTGQVNGVLFLLMIIGGLGLLSRKKNARALSIASGAAFGVVAVVKYFSVAFLPLLILRKQWLVLAGFIIGIAAVASLSLLVFSPQDVARYALGVHDSAVQGELASDDSTTLRGSYSSALKEGKTIAGLSLDKSDPWSAHRVFRLMVELLTGIAAIVIGVLYVRDWKKANTRPWLLDYTIAMSFLLLFANASHRQFHLFLLPFIIWCFSEFVVRQWRDLRQYVLPAFGILLFALTQYYNWTTPSPTYTLFFLKPPTIGIAMMLIAACYLRFKKPKKTTV